MNPAKRVYRSWGRLWPPTLRAVAVSPAAPRVPACDGQGTFLPFGNGRSYGDSCLNNGGTLLDARPLDRVLSFDHKTGILRCQGGVLLSRILEEYVPRGWFLPVTPGTKFVTVAGAIANDVHGKNHHRAGTFGRHVLRLMLLRSDGSRTECSPENNADLFRATVGGLGLTGLILWAEIRLRPVASRCLDVETTRFSSLEDFFHLSAESDDTHEHTVAWIDCMARGRRLGRGWFFRGNPQKEGDLARRIRGRRRLNLFFDPPVPLVNRVTLKAFNAIYYHRPVPKPGPVDYEPFFYPLDAILNWNRMYGPRGFFQFQCVLPRETGVDGIQALLERLTTGGQASFLAVLKVFGTLKSPGLLSFPRPGPTLAVDIPNRGRATRTLMAGLEDIVLQGGGAIYPAKDACMSPQAFQRAFPTWRALEALRDPCISSSFWRRVTHG